MTASARAAWTFTGTVSADRSDRLLSYATFDEVAELLSSAYVDPLYWEAATAPHLKGCHRASFTLKVDSQAYDAFFNAPAGYRGQYALGETRGAGANQALLAALTPKLLQAIPTSAVNLPVSTSLRAKQAKIWIVESEVEDQLSEPSAAIACAEWEFNEPGGQGLRAPIGTTLEVKGGWIDSAGLEIVNPYKCGRGLSIYRTGDSK